METNKVLFATASFLIGSVAFSQNLNQEQMEKQIKSKTIVFIHGLFMNNQIWDDWKTLFEEEGYTCYAPAHPMHEGNPAALRANPPQGLERGRLPRPCCSSWRFCWHTQYQEVSIHNKLKVVQLLQTVKYLLKEMTNMHKHSLLLHVYNHQTLLIVHPLLSLI